jgi:hypothetical protein
MTIEIGALYLAQEDGGLPTTLAAGSALGESGVSVFSLRFRGGLHFSATPRQHLIWFGSPVRIDCRIAGRTLWHKAPAGSLAICPAGIDCGADAEASVDALVVAIDPGRLALAAAEALALEAQLNERLSGHDQVLLDLARFLASESARDYPNGPLYWNEVASGFTDSLGCVLFFPRLGKTDHRESRIPAFMSRISYSRAPRIRSTTPLITSSSAGPGRTHRRSMALPTFRDIGLAASAGLAIGDAIANGEHLDLLEPRRRTEFDDVAPMRFHQRFGDR